MRSPKQFTAPTRTFTFLLAAGSIGFGCTAAPKPEPVMVPPISGYAQAQIRTVGVLAPPSCLSTEALPDVVAGAGEGARYGAGKGAVAGLTPLAVCQGSPIACIGAIFLSAAATPVGAIVGTVVGAAGAHSAEEVEAAKATMTKALSDFEIARSLETGIAQSGEALTPARFLACSAEPGSEPCAGKDAPRPDATVTVRTLVAAFPSSRGLSPDFPVVLNVDACVTKESDGEVLYAGRWRYQGPNEDYFEMVEDDAAELRRQLGRAVDAVSDAIVRDAFVGPPQPETNVQGFPPRSQEPDTVLRWPQRRVRALP